MTNPLEVLLATDEIDGLQYLESVPLLHVLRAKRARRSTTNLELIQPQIPSQSNGFDSIYIAYYHRKRTSFILSLFNFIIQPANSPPFVHTQEHELLNKGPRDDKRFNMESLSLVPGIIQKFVADEKRRKATRNNHLSVKKGQMGRMAIFYCPYHKRQVRHRPEDCRLNLGIQEEPYTATTSLQAADDLNPHDEEHSGTSIQ